MQSEDVKSTEQDLNNQPKMAPDTDIRLTWTRGRLKRFKKAYNKAYGVKQGSFQFEAHTFHMGFAKHLIEYLEQHFYNGEGRK